LHIIIPITIGSGISIILLVLITFGTRHIHHKHTGYSAIININT
jgi:hypothetical protein